jgi:pilus assembly protein Flp/PilA
MTTEHIGCSTDVEHRPLHVHGETATLSGEPVGKPGRDPERTLMFRYLRKVARHAQDRGASAVEYGLMVAAIAAVIVAIVFGLGKLVQSTFDKGSSCIAAGIASTC